MIIFTKFHKNGTKIVDLLLMANFWVCPGFFASDFVNIVTNLCVCFVCNWQNTLDCQDESEQSTYANRKYQLATVTLAPFMATILTFIHYSTRFFFEAHAARGTWSP